MSQPSALASLSPCSLPDARYCLELKVARGYTAAAAQLVAACCLAAEHRPEHWQAQAAALATVGTAHVATDPWHGAGMSGGSEAGSEHGAAGNATQHLSFCIPQTQADLPALFEALEHGRQGGCFRVPCEVPTLPSGPSPRACWGARAKGCLVGPPRCSLSTARPAGPHPAGQQLAYWTTR